MGVTVITTGYVEPDYSVVRDNLQIQALPGSGEGPALGALPGIVVMLVVAGWATRQLRPRVR